MGKLARGPQGESEEPQLSVPWRRSQRGRPSCCSRFSTPSLQNRGPGPAARPLAGAPARSPPSPTWTSQGRVLAGWGSSGRGAPAAGTASESTRLLGTSSEQHLLTGSPALSPLNRARPLVPHLQMRRLRTTDGEAAWSRSPREMAPKSGLQPLATEQCSGLPGVPQLPTRPPHAVPGMATMGKCTHSFFLHHLVSATVHPPRSHTRAQCVQAAGRS